MESKLREKNIKDTISYINKNFNDSINNNIQLLVKYIIPYVNSLEFTIDDAIQLLEKCPKLVDTISEFRKRNNKFNRDSALLNGYYLITNNDVDLIGSDDIMNSLEDEKKSYLSYLTDIDYVKAYFKEISKYPVLTKEETTALFKKYADADNETKELIKEKIINHNLRWAAKIARKYIGRGVDFLDLIEEGNIGLIRAVDKYDYKLGYSFATYATWWIKQSITRYLDEYSKAVRLPVHMAVEINKYEKYLMIMTVELGREPKDEEIAKELNVSTSKIEKYKKCLQSPLYLDTPVNSQDESNFMTFGDLIGDENNEIDLVADKLLLKELAESVKNDNLLTEREKEVLILRFGLFGRKSQSLEQVAKVYHLTRERIRQIEAKALQKLRRKYSKNNKFKAFFQGNELKLRRY